jgi:uncharacterized protein YqeY
VATKDNSMSALLEKIKTDLNQALKAKKADEVTVLRFLLADLHNREIEKKGELSDEDVVAVIRKQVKQGKEAIEEFKKGEREDLARKEGNEVEILNKYLPQMFSSEEVEKIVDASIEKTGAKSAQDFGKVMGEVMKTLKGQADGTEVARIVKAKLA